MGDSFSNLRLLCSSFNILIKVCYKIKVQIETRVRWDEEGKERRELQRERGGEKVVTFNFLQRSIMHKSYSINFLLYMSNRFCDNKVHLVIKHLSLNFGCFFSFEHKVQKQVATKQHRFSSFVKTFAIPTKLSCLYYPFFPDGHWCVLPSLST